MNLIGKDILWFHAVIWPAMLIAAGLEPPKQVYAHGFFTINGQKMSKSLGNVIVPSELVERFGVDGSRYLLVSEFPFGVDGDVSMPSLVAGYNAELANDLGNLLNRTVSMIDRYCYGEVPTGRERIAWTTAGGRAHRSVGEYFERIDALDFPGAISAIRDLVTRANRYVEETAPWTLAKSDRERLSPVLYNLGESLRIVAELVWPFMPDSAEAMVEQLGTTLAPSGGRAASSAGDTCRRNSSCACPAPLSKARSAGGRLDGGGTGARLVLRHARTPRRPGPRRRGGRGALAGAQTRRRLVVAVGYDLATSEASVALARRDGVWAAVGSIRTAPRRRMMPRCSDWRVAETRGSSRSAKPASTTTAIVPHRTSSGGYSRPISPSRTRWTSR